MNANLKRLLFIVAVALSAATVLLVMGKWQGTALVGATRAAAAPETDGNFAALDTTLAITADCRLGAAGTQPFVNFIAGQGLGIGWNMDFGADYRSVPIPGSEYINVVRTVQDKDSNFNYLNSYQIHPSLTDGELGAAIARQPGALWLVGNEPDRGPNVPNSPNRVQDDTYPQVYARAYHDAYTFIKAHDPTAQVAIAGLVEVTPGRLQYLDIVWNTYQSLYGTPMPVDVWNMHIYVLPEARQDGTPDEIANVAKGTDLSLALRESTFTNDTSWCTQLAYLCLATHDDFSQFPNQWNFARQVTSMRTWMKNHGQQNKPLILSEFGQLYPCLGCDNLINPSDCFPRDELGHCFTPGRAANFLTASFNYLYNTTDPNLGYPLDNNRLVQQWMWFSLNYPGFENSNLVTQTSPLALTVAGNAFKNMAAAIPQTINLMARSTRQVSIQHGGDHVTATVAVNVLNNGNVAPSSPTAITVYADAARTIPLGTGYLTGAKGCARQEATAYVSFPLPDKWTTRYNYYVRVDPGNALGEPTMADNDTSGFVLPDPHPLYLPVIRR